MAIRRCPYCKAIIDEQDKYCNNCGTQLLFPEDEYVEEEIPGDKIIDDDDEEEEEEELVEEELGKAASIEEEEEEDEEEEEEEEEISAELEKTEGEKEPREGGGIEEKKMPEEKETEGTAEEEEPEEELEEDEEETGLIEEEEDEYTTSGEISLEESTGEVGAEEEKTEDEEIKKRIEAISEEPEEEEEEEIRDQRLVPPSEEDAAKKYQVSIEEDELVFKTKDLDSLTGTVDEGKENLEEFLESYQEKGEEGEKQISDTGQELPPWVSGMKGGAPAGELEEEEEEKETEEATGEIETEKPPTHPEWATDSGVGIPERVTQSELPLGDTAAGEEQEMAAEEETEEDGEPGRETRQRPGFSLKLKAKLVDLVFITALWLISLWFTSQVIGVSLFRLIAGSPGPVLAFYFILLLLYFFLFLYFLGETLGDHFFSEVD